MIESMMPIGTSCKLSFGIYDMGVLSWIIVE